MNPHPDSTIENPTADRELVITRVFDAPRCLVFDAWTKEEHTRRWFVPNEMTLVDTGGDLRVGGAWWTHMKQPDGEDFKAAGVYREIVPGERLVFTHAWEGDDGKPEHETLVTVTFADAEGGKTLMTFKQAVLRSKESRDSHRVGWSQCFDHLEEHLAHASAALVKS